MKFKTTIKYQEGFLPTKRSRKLRYKNCEEIVYTEIKQTTKDLVPVAFMCGDYEYRLCNDSLYSATSENDIVCNMKDKTTIERLSYLFEKCSTFYGFNEDDTKEKMIEKANNYANNYLIIDGEVWKKTGEPRYVINTFGLNNNHGGTFLSAAVGYNPNLSYEAYYSALERDKAIEAALLVANDRGDTNYIEGIKKSCEIKILIPSAVKCNPKLQHCK